MKKQQVKELKQQFQLPGKFSITLENLLGEGEKFLRKISSNFLSTLKNTFNHSSHLDTTLNFLVT